MKLISEYLFIIKPQFFGDVHKQINPIEPLLSILDKRYCRKETNTADNHALYTENPDSRECLIQIDRHNGSVATQFFVTVTVSGNQKKTEPILSKINGIVLGKQFSKKYNVFFIQDDLSQMYCKKLYTKISTFERWLKKLMVIVYCSNYGVLYYGNSVRSDKMERRLSHLKKVNNENLPAIAIGTMDFDCIKDTLFKEKWTKADQQELTARIEEIDDSKSYTGAELKELADQLRPKCDWDKLFKPYFPQWDAASDISDIQKIRNTVAHCGNVSRHEFEIYTGIIDRSLRRITRVVNRLKGYEVIVDELSKDNDDRSHASMIFSPSHAIADTRLFDIARMIVGGYSCTSGGEAYVQNFDGQRKYDAIKYNRYGSNRKIPRSSKRKKGHRHTYPKR